MSTTPSASIVSTSPVTTNPPDVGGGPDISRFSLPVAEAAEDWVIDAASDMISGPVATTMLFTRTLLSLANDSGSTKLSARGKDDDTDGIVEGDADGAGGATEAES